jgi:uncharacterized protein YjbI with pentapeptide repeats
MPLPKKFFILLPIMLSSALGAAYSWLPTQLATPERSHPAANELTKLSHTILSTHAESVAPWRSTINEFPAAPHRQAKADPLAGVFRGDWGESLSYAHHDRVIYQGALYLSIIPANQYQPPSLSPLSWRKLKHAPAQDELACQQHNANAQLSECDFSSENSINGLDLHGANLSHAKLSGALGAANLRGAKLRGATVLGTLLINADTQLDHADLSELHSEGNHPVRVESGNLQGIILVKAELYGAQVNASNLSGAQMMGAILTGANFSASDLSAVNLTDAEMSYARLSGSSLSHATLHHAELSSAELSDTDFSGADLKHANLAEADFNHANLEGADLSDANLLAARHTQTTTIDQHTSFTHAICPDGAFVDNSLITSCVGHGF